MHPHSEFSEWREWVWTRQVVREIEERAHHWLSNQTFDRQFLVFQRPGRTIRMEIKLTTQEQDSWNARSLLTISEVMKWCEYSLNGLSLNQ